LRGTVSDSSGAVVSGAQVNLDEPASGFHQARTTGSDGSYSFLQIPPAKYIIKVTGAGFGQQSKQAELLVNQPATVNFTLSIKTSQSVVEVSAETQTLNTTDATIGNAVNNATIEALPMEGRNVPDLLSLQPGVLYLGHDNQEQYQNQDSRSGSVSGARSDQTNLTLDGVDNNDQTKGYAFTGILRSTLDSVEEFRVTTANSNADNGRSSGAQVAMVTKSGTNRLHGSLYEYNRNTDFAANNWFNKQAELSEGLPNKPGELIRNTYGAALGGPVKRDKLFFFVNYEGQRTAENQQQVLTVPTASLKAGNVSYLCTTGPQCSTGTQTLTPSQIASLDPNCFADGTCPWGAGLDPNAMQVLNQYPAPNGFLTGDGLNTASFSWSAPNPTILNTSIAKIDYAMSSRSLFFVRGDLQDDTTDGVPEIPGQPPSTTTRDNSKGFAAGNTWTITNALVNNLRYGYVRQGLSQRGAGNASYASFTGFSNPVAEVRSTLLNVPVNNVVDDVAWVKGKHSLQFGANYRLIHNNTMSDNTSYNSASTEPQELYQAGIANLGFSLDPSPKDPASKGLYPAVASSFVYSYDDAITAVTGLLGVVTNTSNYQVAHTGNTGSLLPTGGLIPRDFKANEFETYLEDSWRVKPNLTLTMGLRYTLLQTPYEINGQQVQPNINVDQWFKTRASQAALGNSVEPPFEFIPSGQSRGAKPYWPMNKLDFAPRFAVAYSPNADGGLLRRIFGGPGKSSIRAGFGMYYDHFGQGIVDSFSTNGSFGLTTSVSTPNNVLGVDDASCPPGQPACAAPRFTGLTGIPDVTRFGVTPAPANVNYPQGASTNPFGTGFITGFGLDDHLKTPYSYAMNFSVQRELPHGFTLETAYVGRLGRHLLQQLDLAENLNLVDKKSGMSYIQAGRLLDAAMYSGVSEANIKPIPYWEDMFPDAAGLDAQGTGAYGPTATATQNIYADPSVGWMTFPGGEQGPIYFMDEYCNPGCGFLPVGQRPAGTDYRYWNSQYSSLYSWASIGTSSYNAGQFTLRHTMSHGLQTDFSYTLAKSLDMGSDSERQCANCAATSSSFSEIINSWYPKWNKGVSDFDTRHQVTGDWVYKLPFGRGQALAGGASGLLDAFIGGWQFSGLGRWTSGLPFGVQQSQWSTNWNYNSYMVQTGPIQTGTHIVNGVPQAFANPGLLVNGLPPLGCSPNPCVSTDPYLRNPWTGEVGERNQFRGDGFFGIDMGLAKSWKVGETQSLKFTWEVFNVSNAVRFDASPATLQTSVSAANFGAYSALLTTPRVQQFSLRYSF
jgi:hypothetical protein